MFFKTRRENIPVGSGAASLLLTVFVNMSVFCTLLHRSVIDITGPCFVVNPWPVNFSRIVQPNWRKRNARSLSDLGDRSEGKPV